MQRQFYHQFWQKLAQATAQGYWAHALLLWADQLMCVQRLTASMVVGGYWQQVPREHVPKTAFSRLVSLGEKLSFRMVCADVAKRPAEGFQFYNVRPVILHEASVPVQAPSISPHKMCASPVHTHNL